MKTPRIEQLANNFTTVSSGGLTWFFSYQTCVAFKEQYTGSLYIAGTEASGKGWSRTTRRHLNALKCGGLYLPYAEWKARLERAESEQGFAAAANHAE
jgi:hypothetical protein